MSSITLQGTLKDPAGFFAIGDKIRFIHESNTGLVVKSSEVIITIPTSGSYNIELQYGNVRIDYKDANKESFKFVGTITVNQDTTATTIPELLLSAVPPTDQGLLAFQILLQDCKDEVALAEGHADDAEQSATEAATSATNAAQSAVDAQQANVELPEPDVFLPFNNKIVDSVGGALDFTRASAAQNVNKSGIVETLGVDEPAITKDGISSYQEFTNSAIYSVDFSQWNISGSGIIADYMNHPAPDGSNDATKLASTEGNKGVFKSNQVSTLTSNASVWAKGENGGESLRFGISGNTATITLTSEWVRYSMQGDGSGSSSAFDIFVNNSNETVYIWGAQSTDTSELMPFVKTEAAQVTRAADVIKIPAMNNLPAQGEPFTIVCDADIPNSDKHTLWRVSKSGNIFHMNRNSKDDTVRVNGYTGTPTLTIPFANTVGLKRYAFRYAGNDTAVFSDGVKYGVGSGDLNINYTGEITIGRVLASGSQEFPLNSEISNFRIYHRALTDEQIERLGAAT